MSTAHRPNFSAAKARGPNAQRSVQTTVGSLPQHSKLKFRTPSTAASASASTSGRDLKRELEEAEWEAANRKRLRDGLEALPPKGPEAREEDGEGQSSRQAMMRKALELDRDSSASSAASSSSSSSSSSDEEEENKDAANDKGSTSGSTPSSDSDSDSDESEDEQTQLLLELQKIKSERAAEKARLTALSNHHTDLSREQEIARGNPLLNLQHAFSSTTASDAAESEPDFAVKKRWDHDVIFKNQSSGAGNTGKGAKGGFVNDLTRSEFHKKFMNRYIK